MHSKRISCLFRETISMDSEGPFFLQLISAEQAYRSRVLCGWCVQCKSQQFLNFLRVLNLNLTYLNTVEMPSSVKQTMWYLENGTHWCSRSRAEVLAEMNEQNTDAMRPSQEIVNFTQPTSETGSSVLEWKCNSSFSMLFSYPTSGNKPEVEIPSFKYTPPMTVLQQSVKIINRHSRSHAINMALTKLELKL